MIGRRGWLQLLGGSPGSESVRREASPSSRAAIRRGSNLFDLLLAPSRLKSHGVPFSVAGPYRLSKLTGRAQKLVVIYDPSEPTDRHITCELAGERQVAVTARRRYIETIMFRSHTSDDVLTSGVLNVGGLIPLIEAIRPYFTSGQHFFSLL